MSVARLLLLAALVSAGCSNLGIGKVVPGAGPRYRAGKQFARQDLGGGWYRMGPIGAAAEEVGGGRFGAIAGGRLGLGTMHLGDRPALHGAGFDVRLEGMFEVMPFLGLGASVGWGIESASRDDLKVTRRGTPLAAIATLTPLRPFVVRGAVVYEPGTTTVSEVDTGGARKGFDAAAGIAVAFRGWQFVILVDWRHLGGVDVMTPTGAEPYSSDLYLLDAWVAF